MFLISPAVIPEMKFVLTPTESDAEGKPMLAEAEGRPIPADPSTDIPAPGQDKRRE